MNDRIRDPAGTGVALLVGTVLGITLAAPMLPRELPLDTVTLGPVGTTVLVGLTALVAVPLTLLVAYALLKSGM